MTEHEVVVVGGGPTGLMLAGELALAGVDVLIVERRADQDLEGSRSGGLHSRTLEVLDQRGIVDRFLAEGQAMQVQSLAGIPVDITDFPTRHNYGLALWQKDFERILAGWVAELGVPVARQREVTGFTQDQHGVHIDLSDGGSLMATHLVGCDGGRSTVRKIAGIEFSGWDASVSSIVAEVELAEEPQWGLRRDHRGQHGIGPLGEPPRARVVVSESYHGPEGEPTLADLSEAMIAVWATDFGVRNPTWISRFTDASRQAAAYRQGRVLLAGDAAHVHYPIGGQGLNIGVQDAVNLGWKLSRVVKGTSPDRLLDTYHAERHPVAARALQTTMAATVLTRGDGRTDALRDVVTNLLAIDEARRRMAGALSGLDLRYEIGNGHPLVGRRMPDLDLHTADGPLRLYTLLHEAQPVLVDLGPSGENPLGSTPRGPVRSVAATCDGDGLWDLPVLGPVRAPRAVLIRPDGHVAWAGQPSDPALPMAVATWFGAAPRS